MLRTSAFVATATLFSVLGCGGATTSDGAFASLPLEFEQLSFVPTPASLTPTSRPTDAPGLQGAMLVFSAKTSSPDEQYTVRSSNHGVVPAAWATTFCSTYPIAPGESCTVTVAAQTADLGRATLDVIDARGVLAGVIRLHVRRPSSLGVIVERARDHGLKELTQSTVTLGLDEEVALYPVPNDGGNPLSVGYGGYRFDVPKTDIVRMTDEVFTSAPLRFRGEKTGETSVGIATASGVSTTVVVRVVR